MTVTLVECTRANVSMRSETCKKNSFWLKDGLYDVTLILMMIDWWEWEKCEHLPNKEEKLHHMIVG